MNVKKAVMPSEFEEQVRFVQWLDLVDIPYSSIPNSTYTTSWKQKNNNHLSGLRPGLPDLLMVVPNIGLIFVEMKKRKGGVVSEHQKRWIQILNTVPNVEAKVCNGSDEAISYITEFLPKQKRTIKTSDFDIF